MSKVNAGNAASGITAWSGAGEIPAGILRMKTAKLNKRISGLIEEAKSEREMLDVDLAEMLQMSTSTLRNLRCAKTLYALDFWRVVKIAELAGYEVQFREK